MRRISNLGLGFTDLWILGFSFVAILLSSYLLFQDRVLREWAGFNVADRERIGQLLSVNQDVRRRVGNSMAWFPALDREMLYENDSIFTGENSEASLQLKAGQVIGIGANSLVILRKQSENVFLDLQLGGVVATLKKGTQLKVKQGDSVAVLQASEPESKVKLRRSQKGHITVSAFQGQVQMRVKDQEKKITEDLDLEINTGGSFKEIIHSVKLTTPVQGQKFWLTGEEKILFSWLTESNVKLKYRIQVANNEEFQHPLLETEVSSLSYTGAGMNQEQTYYWRIQGQEEGKQEWISLSSTNHFFVINKEAPVPLYPFSGLTLASKGKAVEVKFEWQEKMGVETYRWQLAKEGQFKEGLKETVTSLTYHSGVSLEPGEYHWRVKAEDSSPLGQIWSKDIPFKVEGLSAPVVVQQPSVQIKPVDPVLIDTPPPAPPEPPLPEKMEEPENKVTQQLKLNPPLLLNPQLDLTLNFSPIKGAKGKGDSNSTPSNPPSLVWERVSQAENYEIEISGEKNFSQGIQNLKIKETKITWKKVKPGQYYWRVRATKGDIKSDFSRVGKINVDLPAPQQPASKETEQKVKSPQLMANQEGRIPWTWSPVPDAKKYEVQIGRDSQLKHWDQTVSVNKPEINLPLKPGVNYVQISAVGEQKVNGVNQEIKSKPSSPSKVTLKNRFIPSLPRVEGPENGLTVVSFGQTSDPIILNWEEVPYAKEYTLQVSTDYRFKEIAKEYKIKENKLILNSGDFSGRVYWRVQAVTDGEKSKWTRTRYFSIKKQKEE